MTGRISSVTARSTAAQGASTAELSDYVTDSSPRVRRVVASRVDAPEPALLELASDSDRHTRQAVVANPSCPVAALLILLNDGDRVIAFDAVQHRNAAAAVYEAAYDQEDSWLRESLGQIHDTLPEPIAEKLIGDPARDVREQIAASSRSPEVLHRLARDSDWRVRATVGSNPASPIDLIERLAADRRNEVRSSVLVNPTVPAEVIALLAQDQSASVRWGVAAFHPERSDLMKTLVQDSDTFVADQAEQALRGGPDIVAGVDPSPASREPAGTQNLYFGPPPRQRIALSCNRIRFQHFARARSGRRGRSFKSCHPYQHVSAGQSHNHGHCDDKRG